MSYRRHHRHRCRRGRPAGRRASGHDQRAHGTATRAVGRAVAGDPQAGPEHAGRRIRGSRGAGPGDRAGRSSGPPPSSVRPARSPVRGRGRAPPASRADRPRDLRPHPAPVPQPGHRRHDGRRPLRLRRRLHRLPVADGLGRLRRPRSPPARSPTSRRSSTPSSRSTTRRAASTSTRIPTDPATLAKAKKVYTPALLAGMEAGLRRPLPEVRASRLPGAVVPELAVVRVPVPRFEVQPGRREEGRPGPRGLDRFALSVGGRLDHRSTPRPSSSGRRSAPTPPGRARKGRTARDGLESDGPGWHWSAERQDVGAMPTAAAPDR